MALDFIDLKGILFDIVLPTPINIASYATEGDAIAFDAPVIATYIESGDSYDKTAIIANNQGGTFTLNVLYTSDVRRELQRLTNLYKFGGGVFIDALFALTPDERWTLSGGSFVNIEQTIPAVSTTAIGNYTVSMHFQKVLPLFL